MVYLFTNSAINGFPYPVWQAHCIVQGGPGHCVDIRAVSDLEAGQERLDLPTAAVHQVSDGYFGIFG